MMGMDVRIVAPRSLWNAPEVIEEAVGVDHGAKDVANAAQGDQLLHRHVGGKPVAHQQRPGGQIPRRHRHGIDRAEFFDHGAKDVQFHDRVAAFAGTGIKGGGEIAVLCADQVGQAGGDLERIEVRATRQATHDGNDLQIRALHRADKAGRDVERIAPGHAEKPDRGIGEDLGQEIAEGCPDNHLDVTGVHRGRGDIGLAQVEAGFQCRLQFGAGGKGGVEGDAHQPPRPRVAQSLVDAQTGGAQFLGDLFLRQTLDVVGPCHLRQKPLLCVDLGQLGGSGHERPLLDRAHGQAAHEVFRRQQRKDQDRDHDQGRGRHDLSIRHVVALHEGDGHGGGGLGGLGG